MKYQVIKDFTVKTSQGEMQLQTGQVITMPDDKAIYLIERGLIKPITPEQIECFEERAAIMQYDGGLSKEDAERFAWCYSVCMLTENMSKLCERIKPVPCPRFQREDFERWRRHD